MRQNSMDCVNITELSLETVEAVADIEKECFSIPWSKESIKETLNDKRYLTLVAKDGKMTVGFATCFTILDEGSINNIAVTSKYRNMGIASAIIKSVIDYGIKKHLSFWTLEVRKSNFAAINLYKRFGFEQIGIRKNFYEKPSEDGLLMTLNLTKMQ